MILRSDSFYLFLLFASVISSFVFCLGFFPYANMKEFHPRFNETSANEIYVNRSILMIIDALRLDFIEHESFSYLNQLLDQKDACIMQLTVNLPTVTKPRIKVSKNFPSFSLDSVNISFISIKRIGTYIGNDSKFFRRCHELR